MLTHSNSKPSIPGTVPVEVELWESDGSHSDSDQVAIETPVALSYNGISHAVMMTTPNDLKDFALGFSLTEGIIDNPEEIKDLNILAHSNGVEIAMEISSRRMHALKQQRRNMAGRTGCGVCGIESLQQVLPKIKPLGKTKPVGDQQIQKALSQLEQWQPLRQATGACHGTAWCERDEIILAREDVGRHNALDKLIGALVKQGIDRTDGFVIISSRASYEMVQKVAVSGIGTIVAVSAPTSLALQQARQSGVQLVGFGRPGRHVNYTSLPSHPPG